MPNSPILNDDNQEILTQPKARVRRPTCVLRGLDGD